MPKLFYLGPQTSYTDVAKELFKKEFNLCDYEDVERKTITAVANELSNLEDDNSFAVLPIENSIEGVVKESIDNISRIENKDIKIQAECIVPINHCLVSYAEKINDIKTTLVSLKVVLFLYVTIKRKRQSKNFSKFIIIFMKQNTLKSNLTIFYSKSYQLVIKLNIMERG